MASPYCTAAAAETGFSTHWPGDFRFDWRNSVVAGLAALICGLMRLSESHRSNWNAASVWADFASTTPKPAGDRQQRHARVVVVGPVVPDVAAEVEDAARAGQFDEAHADRGEG